VVKLHAIFGGKNPHPNFVVGGVPCPIDLNSGLAAINSRRWPRCKAIIDQMRTFVEQVYVPDTLAIAGFYKDWFERGEGSATSWCYGDFPPSARASMRDPSTFLFPPARSSIAT
jgi:hydrogenase large subunit